MSQRAETFLLPSGDFLSEIPGERSFDWWALGATAHESRDRLLAVLRSYFYRHLPEEDSAE
jgi:cation diffusion facilitator CzcD-associated flavoprotein CzcO